MKKIIKFVSVIALGLGLAACSKVAPSKSEVEATFDAFTGTLPQLTLAANPKVDAVAGKAEVELTISGLDTSLDSLSVGVMSTLDPTFATAGFSKVESPANGTVKVSVSVSANSTYYIKAAAACTAGTAYSEVLEVKVPDVPFYLKVPGTYLGTISSLAFGDTYSNHAINIYADETDPEHICYIANIEPYYAINNGYTYEKYGINIVQATIDSEAQTITVANGTSMNFKGEGYDYLVLGINADATAYTDIVYTFDGKNLVLTNSYYCYENVNGKAEDWYGNATYVKQ